jgi:hypothetical protein
LAPIWHRRWLGENLASRGTKRKLPLFLVARAAESTSWHLAQIEGEVPDTRKFSGGNRTAAGPATHNSALPKTLEGAILVADHRESEECRLE